MPELSVNLAVFFLLAVITLVSALMFVSRKNIVHSVLWFLLTMLSVAGTFFLLRAPFLAAAQILVYAGAITVLFLFVVMLTMTRIPEVRVFGSTQVNAPLAATFLVLFLLVTVVGVTEAWSAVAKGGVQETTLTAALGQVLFRDFLLPFELAAFVLLITLIAAIFLALGAGRE